MSILKKRNPRLFGYGAVIGFVALSIALASVPRKGPSKGMITDDTAIYQQLSEIRVSREASPNFDADIQRLSSMEPRYREKLPLSQNARIQAPLERVSKQSYRYKRR